MKENNNLVTVAGGSNNDVVASAVKAVPAVASADDLPAAKIFPVITDAEIFDEEQAGEVEEGSAGRLSTFKRRVLCLGATLAVCVGIGLGVLFIGFGSNLQNKRAYPECQVEFFFEWGWIGDGYCDGYSYNTVECGYDGGDCAEANEKLRQSYPDCILEDGSFDPESFADGRCDGEFNVEGCGWDGGDCDEKNKILWNTYPDCRGGVDVGNIGDGFCDSGAYNTAGCGWDGGDCVEFNEKYPNCNVTHSRWVGDGFCDGEEYDTIECGHDGNDCL